MSVLGLIMSSPPYLRSAMVRFPLYIVHCRVPWDTEYVGS